MPIGRRAVSWGCVDGFDAFDIEGLALWALAFLLCGCFDWGCLMAGGIDWFRWHHGSVTDPKFLLVARRAGASLPDVLAVWAYLLEQASASERRGEYGAVDFEAIDCLFGFPSTETRTANIVKAMQDRGLTDGPGVVAWEKRQPAREDTTAAERKRRQREREHELQLLAEQAAAGPDLSGSKEAFTDVCDGAVTGGVSRSVTRGHDRGEERRGEESNSPPFVAKVLKNSVRRARADFEIEKKSGPGSGLAGNAGVDLDSAALAELAGESAAAMVSAGLPGVSASDPRLRALLSAGLTVAELVEAATAAKKQNKSLAWALTRAENRRHDAAAFGALPLGGAGGGSGSLDPDSQQAVEADGVRFGLGRWVQLLPGGQTQSWPVYAARVRERRAAEKLAGGEVAA